MSGNNSLDVKNLTSGLDGQVISAEKFTLQSYISVNDQTKTSVLRIYLEGDGYAYITPFQPSFNPTPKNPVALKLMLADTDNIRKAYLARPCQYIKTENCTQKYWTSHRLALEVISATDAAIDILKGQYQAKDIELVGYSGGGGLALLLAKKRNDVVSIRTVAANLDTEIFTQFHRLTPMIASLNPADVHSEHIPQRHYGGEKDRVIPPLLLRKTAPQHQCSSIKIVLEASHGQGWESVWPALLSESLDGSQCF